MCADPARAALLCGLAGGIAYVFPLEGHHDLLMAGAEKAQKDEKQDSAFGDPDQHNLALRITQN